MLKCFATFSVDCGLKSSSVFPVILAFNLTLYACEAPQDDGLSSLCTSKSPGGCGDHQPTRSAGPADGGSVCSSSWTHFPHLLVCVWAVPLTVPRRVGARVAGTAPPDGGPEAAVRRQPRRSPRHADLDLKLV